MNQLNTRHIKTIAGKISKILHSENLKETTLKNLNSECQPTGEDFYLALDLLAKENKIFFLVTPKETYVLPIA